MFSPFTQFTALLMLLFSTLYLAVLKQLCLLIFHFIFETESSAQVISLFRKYPALCQGLCFFSFVCKTHSTHGQDVPFWAWDSCWQDERAFLGSWGNLTPEPCKSNRVESPAEYQRYLSSAVCYYVAFSLPALKEKNVRSYNLSNNCQRRASCSWCPNELISSRNMYYEFTMCPIVIQRHFNTHIS